MSLLAESVRFLVKTLYADGKVQGPMELELASSRPTVNHSLFVVSSIGTYSLNNSLCDTGKRTNQEFHLLTILNRLATACRRQISSR